MNTVSVAITFVFFIIGLGYAQLSPAYYNDTCPNLLSIIEGAVEEAVSADQRMAASLLRMHFHDCFVQGCDASVLLDDTVDVLGEKTASPNKNSLRGFDVIDDIKARVEAVCPGVVSCADIIAVAARDSVVALGGPSWTLPLGRRDSTTAGRIAAERQLPGPSSTLVDLVELFGDKGFTAAEMVTLSGAHTIGQASCRFFRNRIYNDANINASYATELRAVCPRRAGDGDANLSPLDRSTAAFNNDYYKDLLSSRGLFHSDQELCNNGSADAQVRAYAGESASFFRDFAGAMVKMSSLTPLTGSEGEIREFCRRSN